MFDLDDDFYRPVWVRIAITLASIGWGLVELANGNIFWATLFIGIGLYVGYRFFVTFNPKNTE